MIELEWFIHHPFDSEGQRFTVHYLVSPTGQCFATIAEPRLGHILYETDLKVSGYDRSYITLEAAKQHCEFTALAYEEEQREALEKSVKERVPENPVEPRWWKRLMPK